MNKFLLFAFSILLFSSVNAAPILASSTLSSSSELTTVIGKDRKKNKKHKRMNHKRKKACNKWARKSFAG